MPKRSNPIRLYQTLPPVVDSIKSGWLGTAQQGAVVSALAAGIVAQLLGFIKDNKNYADNTDPEKINVLVGMCYFSLFMNIGATISSFVIIDRLGEFHLRAARIPDSETALSPSVKNADLTESDLIRAQFGVGRTWSILLWQWITCFYGGLISLVGMMLGYIWLAEPTGIRIAATMCVGVVAVSHIFFVLKTW
ncbi:hypothetical protein BJ165DRAFT_1522903 [Panaeolus papilionaceus]|nr:hypothetical protein BJ165DRAFT_1522903 [Panaeolus papilionaceus]